jgi:aminoglycoside phosphotransferase (APT) family kinase protein
MTELGPEVLDWIERVTGGRDVETQLVTSGGRLGYRVDVTVDGARRPLFLQRGRNPGTGSFMGFAREAEVYRALEPLGVKVAHVWGVDEALNVLLVDRLDGTVWFQEPPDPQQQVRIAQDFIRQIARWHATPAAELALPSFHPVRSAAEHQREQLKGIRTLFEEEDARRPIDLLARVTLEHLERHIPAYDGPAVLCQGDTGPGNFLYKGDEVVGVVDWELAHLGDPMDDIAWLSWRATQHGFPDFPARMREYEALSGIQVVADRVHYYRVNACARLGPRFGLADMGEGSLYRPGAAQDGQPNDRVADGSQMLMTMLHRRMRLTALAAVLGIEPPSRYVTEEAEPREHAQIFDTVLAQLQTMVPMIAERKASALAKGVARQVKYLKEIDRNAHLFEARELADISRLLGRTVGSTAEGRPALAEAAREGKVGLEGYFHYHWNRMVRDDHMMREASGRMYQRAWPALS